MPESGSTTAPTYEISGDTAVNITAPNGDVYTIRDVGIGHPWHTIGPKGGRSSTAAEYLLATALIAENEKRQHGCACVDRCGDVAEGDDRPTAVCKGLRDAIR